MFGLPLAQQIFLENILRSMGVGGGQGSGGGGQGSGGGGGAGVIKPVKL